MSSVLDQLSRDRDNLLDELQFGAHVDRLRRQSLTSVINFANRIIAMFLPSEPDPDPVEAPELVEPDNYDVRPAKPLIPECLLRKIDQLKLSERAAHCLRNENIRYIGDLVQISEVEFRRMPNFKRKSLNEIKAALASMGLYLGMELENWPPEDLEQLSDRLDQSY